MPNEPEYEWPGSTGRETAEQKAKLDYKSTVELFEKGSGHAEKAAAVHYLFLCEKRYQDHAQVMNEAIGLEGLIKGLGYSLEECEFIARIKDENRRIEGDKYDKKYMSDSGSSFYKGPIALVDRPEISYQSSTGNLYSHGGFKEDQCGERSDALGAALSGVGKMTTGHSIGDRPESSGIRDTSFGNVPSEGERGRECWGLVTVESNSVNRDSYLFGLSDHQQRVHAGNPVAPLVELVMSPEYDASGYEFGFRCVRVATDIVTNDLCEVAVERHYENERAIGNNGQVVVRRGGAACFVEIKSRHECLNGGYYMDQPFCYITPRSVPFQFTGELKVSLVEMNIWRVDGSELPSSNKKAVIAALLAKKLTNDGVAEPWFTLSRLKFEIRSFDG